ncbi:MAG: hypothetical protein AB4290_24005 [Spirulina sp.]
MNNLRALLRNSEYTYGNASETRCALVRVMKTSLRFANPSEPGLAIWLNSQLLLVGVLLVGVCGSVPHAIAQTQDPHPVPPLFNSVERVKTSRIANKIAQQHQPLDGNKKFDPEDNGNPDGTRGTGTRCVNDRPERIFADILN